MRAAQTPRQTGERLPRWRACLATMALLSACDSGPSSADVFRDEATPTPPQMMFIVQPDVGDRPPQPTVCDLFVQDCPADEKCTVLLDDPDRPSVCVPAAAPGVEIGDACTVDSGELPGHDDCPRGSICWDHNGQASCVAFALGSWAQPRCADPRIAAEQTPDPYILCRPDCDPVAQDCGEGFGCYPQGAHFGCLPVSPRSEGTSGDSCSVVNACVPGHICSTDDPACAGPDGCCTAVCDPHAAESICSDGFQCQTLDISGTGSPGSAGVGVCVTAR